MPNNLVLQSYFPNAVASVIKLSGGNVPGIQLFNRFEKKPEQGAATDASASLPKPPSQKGAQHWMKKAFGIVFTVENIISFLAWVVADLLRDKSVPEYTVAFNAIEGEGGVQLVLSANSKGNSKSAKEIAKYNINLANAQSLIPAISKLIPYIDQKNEVNAPPPPPPLSTPVTSKFMLHKLADKDGVLIKAIKFFPQVVLPYIFVKKILPVFFPSYSLYKSDLIDLLLISIIMLPITHQLSKLAHQERETSQHTSEHVNDFSSEVIVDHAGQEYKVNQHSFL